MAGYEFGEAYTMESLQGNIVLSVAFGWQKYVHESGWDEALTNLHILHLRKIDLCDEVLVVNPTGHIGESTAKELEYAQQQGKRIRYWNRDGSSYRVI